MSIQEIGYETAYDGIRGPIGHVDGFFKNIYANSIKLDQPILNTNNNFYQWTAVDSELNTVPAVLVNNFISVIGAPFSGVLNLPSTTSLDTYFGTTAKGIVWSFEIINFTTSTNLLIYLDDAEILTVPPASFINIPSYSKYYFYKKEDNTNYVCINQPR